MDNYCANDRCIFCNEIVEQNPKTHHSLAPCKKCINDWGDLIAVLELTNSYEEKGLIDKTCRYFLTTLENVEMYTNIHDDLALNYIKENHVIGIPTKFFNDIINKYNPSIQFTGEFYASEI